MLKVAITSANSIFRYSFCVLYEYNRPDCIAMIAQYHVIILRFLVSHVPYVHVMSQCCFTRDICMYLQIACASVFTFPILALLP